MDCASAARHARQITAQPMLNLKRCSAEVVVAASPRSILVQPTGRGSLSKPPQCCSQNEI